MKLKNIIIKIDNLRDELEALRPIPEDRLNRLNQKLRLDWNYNSNSIEGNTLTESETRTFLMQGITSNGKPFKDYLEMRGHNDALKKLEEIVHKDLKITESLIKEFHKMILVEPHDSEAEINPGFYKTKPNYLYSPTNERIDFEPPEQVSRQMNELINWLNNHIDPPKRRKHKYDLHPLLIATGFHVRFIQIHPFGDGNGRMARILMNLILMLCGYVPAIIKLEKRKEYYTALNQSTMENLTPIAEFVGMECINSLEMSIKAAKGESIEEIDDLDKKISLLKKEIEGEDEENEIKLKLDAGVLHTSLKLWGYNLLTALATTTSKFNEFYNDPKHSVTLSFDGDSHFFNFITTIDFNEFEKTLENISPEKVLNNVQVRLQTFYGAYKKGGLNPFGCIYTVEIKFDEYFYEIQVGYFEEKSQGQKTKLFTKKLLHKALTTNEIEEIQKMWGETLFNHIEFCRQQLKNNINDK